MQRKFLRWDEAEKGELELIHEQEAYNVIPLISGYEEKSHIIKRAIENPHDSAVQREAYRTLALTVPVMKGVQEFANTSAKCILETLQYLVNFNGNSNEHSSNKLTTIGILGKPEDITKKSYLVKLLGDLMIATYEIDTIKMQKPHILNDFSYFRRISAKIPVKERQVALSDTEASTISMLFGQAMPCASCIANTLTNEFERSESLAMAMANIANICGAMVHRHDVVETSDVEYCLKVMTLAMVIFDLSHRSGSFRRSSPIKSRTNVQVLKYAQPSTKVKLSDSLKYNTRSFNSDSTPMDIKRALR